MKRILFIFFVGLLLPSFSFAQDQLVVPSPETLENGIWLKSLEQSKNLKVTLAISDTDLKKISNFRLRTLELMNEGRLEIALYLSSESITETRLEEAKLTFKNFFGEFPKGFVSSGEILSKENTELVEEAGFTWSLTAPMEQDPQTPLTSTPSTHLLKVQMKVDRSSTTLEFTQIENQISSDLFLQGLRVNSPINNNETSMVSYQFLFKEGAQEKVNQMNLYIDLNHRMGTGKIFLVDKNNVGVPSEDGWEYKILCEKLSSTHWNCQLLSANQPRPLFVTLAPIGKDNSSLEIQIPKKLLGRDPLRWGYLVCIIDSDFRIQDFLSSLEKKGEMLQKLKETSRLDGETLLLPMMRSQ